MQYLQCYTVLSYMIVLLAKFINTTIIAGVDLSNIVLTASKYGSRVDHSLSISGNTESGQLEEANFPVSISKSLYEQTPLIASSPGSPCPFRFICAIFIMFKHRRAALVTCGH